MYPGSILGYFLYGDFKYQPQLTPDFIISTNHLYAFFILSALGFFTYKKSNNLNFVIIYLVLLSITLELMHSIIPVRSFEWSDLFGNVTGVIIMFIINFFLKNHEE